MPSHRLAFPHLAPLVGAAALALTASGCGLVLGLDEFSAQEASATGSGGGTSTSASSSGTGGAPPACTAADAATVCEDKNACTDDTCSAGTCQHTPLKLGTACGLGAKYTCDNNGACLDGQTTWAKGYGSGVGEHSGEAIASDKDGNVLVTGYFKGEADFGDGVLSSPSTDAAFLTKLDGTGK